MSDKSINELVEIGSILRIMEACPDDAEMMQGHLSIIAGNLASRIEDIFEREGDSKI